MKIRRRFGNYGTLSRQEEPRTGRLGAIAGMTAAVATVLITLVSVQPPVSRAVLETMVVLLSGALVMLVVIGLLGTPLLTLCRGVRDRFHVDRVARELFPELRNLVADYRALLNYEAAEQLTGFIQDNGTATDSGLRWLHPSDADTMFRQLHDRIRSLRRGRNFFSSLSEFENLLRIVHQNTIMAGMASIAPQPVHTEEGRRDAYRKGRKSYEKFIEGYMDFNKRLERTLNQKRQSVYFRQLPELFKGKAA